MAMITRTILLTTAFLVSAGQLWAGTTGKIMGTVVDTETGEPLPYANVLLKGTSMGAAANDVGEYFIINVPVGEYTLVSKMMGYSDVETRGVWVSADLSTRMDLRMTPKILDAGQVVEVVVERPLVDRGITASTRIVDGEAIEAMPVSDFEDVLVAQAGVTETDTERSFGVHVRGGRAGEVIYVVDGVNTTDPVTLQRGIILDNNAIAEMTVLSGGFNAEYGEAMSGVVNIVTKEGGSALSGGLEYYTDDLFDAVDADGYDLGTNDVNFSLGGPVPLLRKAMSEAAFFVSGSLRDTDNREPSILPKPRNDRQQQSAAGKLKLRPTQSLKLVFSGNWAFSQYHTYSHQRGKGNWQKERPLFERGNNQFGATLTHTLSPSTFYTVNVARFNTYIKRMPQDGKHYHEWRIIGSGLPWVSEAMDSVYYGDVGWVWYDIENQTWHGIDPEEAWLRYYETRGWVAVDSITRELAWDNLVYERDALNARWFDTGHWDFNADSTAIVYHPFDADTYLWEVANSDDHKSDEYDGDIDQWYRRDRDEFRHFYYDFAPWWHDRNTTHWTGDVSVTHQLGSYNQIKAGGFLRKSVLKLIDLQFYNENPYSDHYEMKPTNMAAYVQDKIEYEDLTVNLGVRWDYFDPAAQHFAQMESLDVGTQKAESKDQFSPRLGISFAVTDRSVLYASYGRFFQPVELGELYQSLNADVTSGLPLIGNPDLPPEKTVAYEVGLRHAFTPDFAGEITAYYKDVKNLLATREIISTLANNPVNYTIFLIDDYAVIKGVDVSLIKRASDFLSGTLSYSYLDAKGTGSSAREFYQLYRGTESPLPNREYPLEFDVTHTFKANLNLYLPGDFGPSVIGFHPVGDLNANMQFTYSSGIPYTPTDSRGNPGDVGSRRLPSTQTTNLRVDKYLSLGKLDMGLFVDVRNLFDRVNVVDVYPRTGQPDDDGNIPLRESYSAAEEWEEAVENWRAYAADPDHYGRPRTVTVGATLNF
jgi:outer membrane receptor protein involved in Fe transport